MSRAKDPRFHAEAGLSFPELLVVTAIFTALLGLVYGTFRYQVGMQRHQTAKVATQAEVRVWLDRMVMEIREAGYDPRERNFTSIDFTILALSPTEIRFTTDFDKDGVLDAGDSRENIGFRLNGGALERWVGAASWRPIVSGIEEFTLACFDAQGGAIACGHSPTSLKRSVSAIEITLSASAESGGSARVGPARITQSATVELRNEIL